MRIVFLSPDEPFYLPDFYKYVLDSIDPKHEVKVIIVPPVYKNTTSASLAIRYAKTFGLKETAAMSCNVIYYKLMNLLSGRKNGRFYSLSSILEKYRIPYLQELDVNSRQNLQRLKDWNTDLIISVSCPQIFKKDLIGLPPKGCLNLHGSLLPDYRGVMPSFWVLANNEKEAGVTLFFVNEKIDAGDVLIQRKYSVRSDDTLDAVIRRSKRIGAEIVVDGIAMIAEGEVRTYPIDMTRGSYYGWPDQEAVGRFLEYGRQFR
ncbi:MAG: hypothetical protein HZB61_01975 [Nitrospirae bacterium]|nr:hypothetical protein [Nitrospirota bacterium]